VITIWAPDGVGEVRRGDDLADHLLGAVVSRRDRSPLASSGQATGSTDGPSLADGDIVCVTSKVVSKAEGRLVAGDRAAAIRRETRRLVARRGRLSIVVNRLGLTMAAAGVDASNVEAGQVLLLPEDPDASARRLRSAIARRAGANVAVLVTDTAGRPWREGQTDIAIGAAGIRVLEDHAGRTDPYGNVLAVTAPATADELAGAAELAAGKLGRRPFVVVRGRADLVLDATDDGPGAAALVRGHGTDLFGFGSREAVLAALRADPAEHLVFGTPLEAAELADLLAALTGVVVTHSTEAVLVTSGDPRTRWMTEVAAYAHGWEVVDAPEGRRLRLRPSTP
jgi:coenzyme F420-0:L-glutamate ligase/coenzyme F420-1:gamma-L-glutamate ligase